MMFVGAAGAGTAEKKQDATVINAAMIAVGVGQGIMTVVVIRIITDNPGSVSLSTHYPVLLFR